MQKFLLLLTVSIGLILTVAASINGNTNKLNITKPKNGPVNDQESLIIGADINDLHPFESSIVALAYKYSTEFDYKTVVLSNISIPGVSSVQFDNLNNVLYYMQSKNLKLIFYTGDSDPYGFRINIKDGSNIVLTGEKIAEYVKTWNNKVTVILDSCHSYNAPLATQLLYNANAKIVMGTKNYEQPACDGAYALLTMKYFIDPNKNYTFGKALNSAISALKANPDLIPVYNKGSNGYSSMSPNTYQDSRSFVYGGIGSEYFNPKTNVLNYKNKILPPNWKNSVLPYNTVLKDYPWVKPYTPALITKANKLKAPSNIKVTMLPIKKPFINKQPYLIYPNQMALNKYVTEIQYNITNKSNKKFVIGNLLISAPYKLYAKILPAGADFFPQKQFCMYNIIFDNSGKSNWQLFHASTDILWKLNLTLDPNQSKIITFYAIGEETIPPKTAKISSLGSLFPFSTPYY